jgi:hypothetical protein
MPAIRLTRIAHLLAFVAQFRCPLHSRQAFVHQLVNGRITYGACCQQLLDTIEQELRGITPARFNNC